MEQWLRDGRRYIRERGRSKVPLAAEEYGFVEDLSGGLRGLLKKILRRGGSGDTSVPQERPVQYAECQVAFQYIYKGSVVDEQGRDDPLELVVGAGHVTQGFDEAVLTMTVGEKAIYWLDPEFAFREKGLVGPRFSLPADEPVQLVIELLAFENPVSPEKRLERAVAIKDEGNTNLRAGRIAEAVEKYRKGLSILSGPFERPPICGQTAVAPIGVGEAQQLPLEDAPSARMTDGQLRSQRDALRAVLHTNLAVCHFELGDYERCMAACSTALTYDSTYAKAYARQALALSRRKEFEKASEILVRMLHSGVGDHVEVKQLLKSIRDAQRREQREECGRYKELFGQKAAVLMSGAKGGKGALALTCPPRRSLRTENHKKVFSGSWRGMSQPSGASPETVAAESSNCVERVDQEIDSSASVQPHPTPLPTEVQWDATVGVGASDAVRSADFVSSGPATSPTSEVPEMSDQLRRSPSSFRKRRRGSSSPQELSMEAPLREPRTEDGDDGYGDEACGTHTSGHVDATKRVGVRDMCAWEKEGGAVWFPTAQKDQESTPSDGDTDVTMPSNGYPSVTLGPMLQRTPPDGPSAGEDSVSRGPSNRGIRAGSYPNEVQCVDGCTWQDSVPPANGHDLLVQQRCSSVASEANSSGKQEDQEEGPCTDPNANWDTVALSNERCNSERVNSGPRRKKGAARNGGSMATDSARVDGQPLGHFVWNELCMLLFGRLYGLLHYWCGMVALAETEEGRQEALHSLRQQLVRAWDYGKVRMKGCSEWRSCEESVTRGLHAVVTQLARVAEAHRAAPQSMCRAMLGELESWGFGDGSSALTSHDKVIRRAADLFAYSYHLRRESQLASSHAGSRKPATNGEAAPLEQATATGPSGGCESVEAPTPSPQQAYRMGRTVRLPFPHPHPDVNTRIVLAEPRRRKTALDDSRIFSHPKKATTYGVEDFLVDEELVYRALVSTKRQLDVYGSLRFASPYNNYLVWHTLDRDDALFDKVYPSSRTGTAPMAYIRMLMKRVEEKLSVFEASRRSMREMALQIGWYAISAHWRDQMRSALEEVDVTGSALVPSYALPDWYQLRDTAKTGTAAIFPNYVQDAVIREFILQCLNRCGACKSLAVGSKGLLVADDALPSEEHRTAARQTRRQRRAIELEQAVRDQQAHMGGMYPPEPAGPPQHAKKQPHDEDSDELGDAEWNDAFLIVKNVVFPILTGEGLTYVSCDSGKHLSASSFLRNEVHAAAALQAVHERHQLAEAFCSVQSEAPAAVADAVDSSYMLRVRRSAMRVTFMPQSLLPAIQSVARMAKLCSHAEFSTRGRDALFQSISNLRTHSAIAEMLVATEAENVAVAPLVAVPAAARHVVECCMALKRDDLFVPTVTASRAAGSLGLDRVRRSWRENYAYFRVVADLIEASDRSDEILALCVPLAAETDGTAMSTRMATATLSRVPRVWCEDHRISMYEEHRHAETAVVKGETMPTPEDASSEALLPWASLSTPLGELENPPGEKTEEDGVTAA